MRIVVPAVNAKQALLALIFLSVVLLTFFATKAWAMSPEAAPPPIAKPSLYDNYVKPKPATTTTSTTTTTTTSTTTTTTTTAPKPTAPVATTAKPIVPAVGDEIYLKLAQCESGDPTYNGSSGYDGAFQFLPSTWNSMNTGYAFAYQAPFDVQLDAAKRLIARSGWGQFPACARKLGML